MLQCFACLHRHTCKVVLHQEAEFSGSAYLEFYLPEFDIKELKSFILFTRNVEIFCQIPPNEYSSFSKDKHRPWQGRGNSRLCLLLILMSFQQDFLQLCQWKHPILNWRCTHFIMLWLWLVVSQETACLFTLEIVPHSLIALIPVLIEM